MSKNCVLLRLPVKYWLSGLLCRNLYIRGDRGVKHGFPINYFAIGVQVQFIVYLCLNETGIIPNDNG